MWFKLSKIDGEVDGISQQAEQKSHEESGKT